MSRIILPSVTCPDLQYFFTLPNKRHDFKKKKVTLFFLFSLQILSETFLILKIVQRDAVVNIRMSSWKVPFILSDFKQTLILSTNFRKKILKYKISWKSVQ